jgi:hypothetical protein
MAKKSATKAQRPPAPVRGSGRFREQTTSEYKALKEEIAEASEALDSARCPNGCAGLLCRYVPNTDADLTCPECGFKLHRIDPLPLDQRAGFNRRWVRAQNANRFY